MILRMMRYDFKLEYVAGKNLTIANALSRDSNAAVHIKTDDPTTKDVIDYINVVWPEHKRDVKPNVKTFWDLKEELH